MCAADVAALAAAGAAVHPNRRIGSVAPQASRRLSAGCKCHGANCRCSTGCDRDRALGMRRDCDLLRPFLDVPAWVDWDWTSPMPIARPTWPPLPTGTGMHCSRPVLPTRVVSASNRKQSCTNTYRDYGCRASGELLGRAEHGTPLPAAPRGIRETSNSRERCPPIRRQGGIAMGQLPLLPVSSIGSCRNRPISSAEMAPLEQQDSVWMRQRQETAVADWLATQERLGIDVLVDGEQYRRSMTTYFLEGWGCADIDRIRCGCWTTCTASGRSSSARPPRRARCS